MADVKDQVICPFCGRPVEAGFKFCDWCGNPLDGKPEPKAAEPKVAEKKGASTKPKRTRSGFFSRGRAPELVEAAGGVPTLTDAEVKPAVEPAQASRAPAPDVETPAPKVEAPAPMRRDRSPKRVDVTRPQAAVTSAEPKREAYAPKLPGGELKPVTSAKSRGPGARSVVMFIAQLVFSFAAGLLLVAIVALIVTLVTTGKTAFLETRGLPVFIGVTASVAVFASLRGTKVPPGRAARAAPIVALVLLVAGGALLYRPTVLAHAQPSVERFVGVWNDADESASTGFQSDLIRWNTAFSEYGTALTAVYSGHLSGADFWTRSLGSHRTFEELVVSMESHARAAPNQRLSRALTNLVGAYQAQLGGIRLVSTGTLENDRAKVEQGDQTYKESKARARQVFDTEVMPLLERAGLDANAFAAAL